MVKIDHLIQFNGFPLPKGGKRTIVENSNPPKRDPILRTRPFQRIARNPNNGAVNSLGPRGMRPAWLGEIGLISLRTTESGSPKAKLWLKRNISVMPQAKSQVIVEVTHNAGLGRPSGRDSAS